MFIRRVWQQLPHGSEIRGADSLSTGKTSQGLRAGTSISCGSGQCRGWQLGVALALGIGSASMIPCDRAFAQSSIQPDNTLGIENSRVNSTNFNGLPVEVIGGGAIRGTNLFHSFLEFNVDEGRGAYFTNPAGVANILSRITGTNASKILGTLGVGLPGAPGTANLFLINPNGILFGPNASLDIGGSFVATTANALQFPDGSLFSATAPTASPPTLSVNPSAFLFNQLAAASITNQSTAGLKVPDGQSLLLLGGNVISTGGVLQAPSGRIELGGVGGGTVELRTNGNSLSFIFPDGVARGGISLTNSTLDVDSTSAKAGSIVLTGGTIAVVDSQLTSKSENDDQTSDDFGLIKLEATQGSVSLNNSVLSTTNFGSGYAGDISITASDQVLIENQSSIFSRGKLGRILIGRSDYSSLSPRTITINNATLNTTVDSGFSVDAGGISLDAGSISLNAATLDTTNQGSGIAGDIIISARDQVSIVNNSQLTSRSQNDNTSSFGFVKIESTQGSVAFSNSTMSTTNFGTGLAGDINITASDRVSIDNQSSIFSRGAKGRILIGRADDLPDTDNRYTSFSPRTVTIDTATLNTDNSSSQGVEPIDAGAIVLRANNTISLTNGSEVSSSTFRQGDAGAVFISSGGSVSLNNSRIFSTVESEGFGRGGGIRINASSLSLNKGAQLQTLVRGVSDDGALPGQGDAGEVNINVSDRVTIDGANNQGFPSAIFSTIGLGANGDAGGITINAKSLYLNDGGRISVDNFGSGGAGDIQLTLREDLRLQNQSSITAVTLSGQGGNMTLIVPDLLVLTRNSDISTTAGIAPGGGDGGKIQINTQYIFGIPVGDNNITAQAYLGSGGSIIIDAAQLYKIGPNSDDFLNTNDITVSSRYGRTGEYRGNVLNTDPNQALNNLPQAPVDASRLIAQRCAVRSPTSGEENKFTVTGTGGLQPNPNETLQNESVVTNWVTLDPKVENSTATPTSTQPNPSAPIATHPSKTPAYTEAQGWVINEKGEVILTAQAPTVTPHNPSLMPVAACNGS